MSTILVLVDYDFPSQQLSTTDPYVQHFYQIQVSAHFNKLPSILKPINTEELDVDI